MPTGGNIGLIYVRRKILNPESFNHERTNKYATLKGIYYPLSCYKLKVNNKTGINPFLASESHSFSDVFRG